MNRKKYIFKVYQLNVLVTFLEDENSVEISVNGKNSPPAGS